MTALNFVFPPWDQQIFQLVNGHWTHPILDSIYPWWREGSTWFPAYLFLVVFVVLNFKWKAFPFILFAVATIVLTDQVSSAVIKPLVERVRPCRDPAMEGKVRLLLNGCSGGYSFPSSHATNHFGFALYLFLTMGALLKKWKWLLLVWAASIAYGQVYVGVHYPIDVLAGSLLGCCLGALCAWSYQRWGGPLPLQPVNVSHGP